MPKRQQQKTSENESLARRLDAIIRLILEFMYANKPLKFNQTTAARILKSVGLSPTEIARIFGKKSARDVAWFLYSKKQGKIKR